MGECILAVAVSFFSEEGRCCLGIDKCIEEGSVLFVSLGCRMAVQ